MKYAIIKENVSLLSAEDLERKDWFHMWLKQLWPYKRLEKGDVLFFFDKKKKRFVWKAEVVDVIQERYEDKNEVRKNYEMTDEYFKTRANSGFFLWYRVRMIEEISNKGRPLGFEFERNGWAEVNNELD